MNKEILAAVEAALNESAATRKILKRWKVRRRQQQRKI